MKLLKLFLIPTIAAWLVGAFACALLGIFDAPLSRFFELLPLSMALNLRLAGLYIVLPAFVVITIPTTIACVRRMRAGRRPLSMLLYASALFLCGLITLGVVLPFDGLTKRTLAASWPLVPYSAAAAFMLFSLLKKEPNQTPEPTAPSGRGSS